MQSKHDLPTQTSLSGLVPAKGLTFIAWLHLVGGAAVMLGGFGDPDHLVECYVIGLTLMVLGWGLLRRRAWSRPLALAVHVVAMLVLVVLTLAWIASSNSGGGGGEANWGRNIGRSIELMGLLAAYVLLAPISVFLWWRLTRADAATLFAPPGRFQFGLRGIMVGVVLAAVLSAGMALQVADDGAIRLLDTPRLEIRFVAPEEMQRRRTAARASADARRRADGQSAIADLVLATEAGDENARKRAIDRVFATRLPSTDLLPLLKHADPRVRSNAVDLLKRLAPGTDTTGIASELARVSHEDDDSGVRTAATAALALCTAGQGDDPAFLALRLAQQDPDVAVRRAALGALTKIASYPFARSVPGSPLVDAWIAALADVDASIRAEGAKRIADVGVPARRSLAALVESLDDTEPAVRHWAAVALLNVGGRDARIVPQLDEALQQPDLELQRAATAALGKRLPDRAGPLLARLIQAATAGDTQVRHGAIAGIGQYGPAAKEAVPALIEMLQEPWPYTKVPSKEPEPPPFARSAAHALGQIGPEARAAAPKLIELLRTWPGYEQYGLRQVLVQSLARIEPSSPEVVQALIRALDDKAVYVRRDAALAFAACGQAGQPGIGVLRGRLFDEDHAVRLYASRALCQLDPGDLSARQSFDDWIKRLVVAIQANDAASYAGGRHSALFSLGELGPDAVEHIPLLVEALRDQHALNRSTAADALGKLGPAAAGAAPALKEALQDEDPAVQVAAEEARFRIESAHSTNQETIHE